MVLSKIEGDGLSSYVRVAFRPLGNVFETIGTNLQHCRGTGIVSTYNNQQGRCYFLVSIYSLFCIIYYCRDNNLTPSFCRCTTVARLLPTPMTPPRKDMIAFAAFDGRKKKPEPRLKGYGG